MELFSSQKIWPNYVQAQKEAEEEQARNAKPIPTSAREVIHSTRAQHFCDWSWCAYLFPWSLSLTQKVIPTGPSDFQLRNHVFLTISQHGVPVGRLVFRLYDEYAPQVCLWASRAVTRRVFSFKTSFTVNLSASLIHIFFCSCLRFFMRFFILLYIISHGCSWPCDVFWPTLTFTPKYCLGLLMFYGCFSLVF